MKPKDLLVLRLQEHMTEPLTALGFRFAASGPHFTRTRGIARQRIDFSLSRWNEDDRAVFWTMWGAGAPEYARWHEVQWGAGPPNDALGGLSDWNIPGWPRGADAHFELTNTSRDALEMRELRRAVEEVGLPFLDVISTWEGAAEHLRAQHSMYHRAVDFLLIAGQPARALVVLREGIRRYEVQGRPDQFADLPQLHARAARYFPGNELAAT